MIEERENKPWIIVRAEEVELELDLENDTQCVRNRWSPLTYSIGEADLVRTRGVPVPSVVESTLNLRVWSSINSCRDAI